MRARDVHCSEVIGEGRRAALLSLHVVVGLMAHAGTPLAQVPPTSSHVIAPPEQAARDNDRVEILRQELRKSEAQLERLAQRQTERLAASDMQAAKEAEDQRIRTLADIAGLKREIASASQVAGRVTVVKPFSARAAQRRTASGQGTAPAWWDVYSSGRRTGAPAPLSLAPAPGQGIRRAPTHPLE